MWRVWKYHLTPLNQVIFPPSFASEESKWVPLGLGMLKETILPIPVPSQYHLLCHPNPQAEEKEVKFPAKKIKNKKLPYPTLKHGEEKKIIPAGTVPNLQIFSRKGKKILNAGRLNGQFFCLPASVYTLFQDWKSQLHIVTYCDNSMP